LFWRSKGINKEQKEKERRICLHELTSATQTCRSKRFYHLMVMLFQKRLRSSKRGVPLTVISDLGLVSRRRLAPTLLITWKKQNRFVKLHINISLGKTSVQHQINYHIGSNKFLTQNQPAVRSVRWPLVLRRHRGVDQLSRTSTKTCSFDSRKKGKMVTLAGRREDVLKYEDVAISVPVPSSSDASNG